MRHEAKVLLHKALDSLFLAIDHFNRPHDRGRPEAVLMLIDRAFELLLKATIVHRGGKIREPGANETFGFDKCIRKCISGEGLKYLSEDEAFTLRTINNLRDAAQHYMVSLSEQNLYMHAQAGLTLFRRILKDVLNQDLTDHFPERILPVTTSPPQDFAAVIQAEFDDIKKLVKPKSRQRLKARAKLRPLAIIEASIRGENAQPGEAQLNKLVRGVAAGKDWTELFPGVASLQLETTGTGLTVSLRITKSEGEPIRLVGEGTPDATTVGVKRVNETSYYSLGARDIAQKLNLSQPRLYAVTTALEIKSDEEFYKEFKFGKTVHGRYSPKALDHLRRKIPELDLDKIWGEHRPRKRPS